MFGQIGLPELVIILLVVLLLFGVGRVSQIGKELGSAVSSFRKGLHEENETAETKDDKFGIKP